MYLPSFEYVRPANLTEAVDALAEYGEEASVYMGGTELLLLMKLGLAAPAYLIDCKRISGLGEITVDDGQLTIGSAVTHRQVQYSPLINAVLPSLSALVAHIGNVRVRAAGTLGGNLCFADPHSDPATLLICLGASMQLRSPTGEREVLCEDFVAGPYETQLAEDEVLTAISLRLPSEANEIAYERIAFRERPILNVALRRAADGFRVVIGGGGRSARRLPEIEDGLDGYLSQRGSGASIAELAEQAALELDPVEDADGDPAYKRQLMRVAFTRAAGRVLR